MEASIPRISTLTKHLDNPSYTKRILIGTVVIATLLGVIAGASLSSNSRGGLSSAALSVGAPKTAQQDNRTFRDFAEGIIRAKSQPSDNSEYVEGTHYLERQGAIPVALTSSVVDLSQYEGKKVKVYGETQKAVKEGWLMDVGKVEEVK